MKRIPDIQICITCITCRRFLPPANEVWGKVIFYTSLSFCSQGGCAWLLGGACDGWSRGACMVGPGGDMRGCSGGGVVGPRGVCMVAPGACVVAPGGHVWLTLGGGHV